MKAYYKFGCYTVYVTRYLFNILKNEGVFALYFPKENSILPPLLDDDVLEKAVLETLTKAYRDNFNKFYDKYVKFDIKGKNAQIDIIFCLDCYCRLHNNFNIFDEGYTYRINLSTCLGCSPQICFDYIPDDREKFLLSIENRKSIKDIITNRIPVTKILIDTNKVTRIVGDYNMFNIMFDNGSSICCDNDKISLTI